MQYAGFPLEEYQKARDKLLGAGESDMHREHLECMADQMRKKYQRAFSMEDDGRKPEVVSELQGIIGKILSSLERQDLR